MVKPGGDELYLELEHDGPVNDFVRREVLPKLTGPKVPAAEEARIKAFVGPGKPCVTPRPSGRTALVEPRREHPPAAAPSWG